MNEAFPGKPFLRIVVHHGSPFKTQIIFSTDRSDLVEKAFQPIIPSPMFFHEYVDFSLTRRAGGENQHVALRSSLFRRHGLIESFDHV